MARVRPGEDSQRAHDRLADAEAGERTAYRCRPASGRDWDESWRTSGLECGIFGLA